MWCYDHDVLHQIFVEKGREKLNKKIDRITTLAGLGALIIFIPMTGYMFGWLITVENQKQILLDSQPKLMQLPLAESWIEEVFAEEHSVEGFKYKVTISDGIGISDDLNLK
jgi:Fe2+ transport system protein B